MALYSLPAGQTFLISLKALIADDQRLLVLRRVPSFSPWRPYLSLIGGKLISRRRGQSARSPPQFCVVMGISPGNPDNPRTPRLEEALLCPVNA